MEHLVKVLEENGFSEREAAVYIASLQLKASPVSTVARHIQENKVTVYSVFKKFMLHGIAKSYEKNNTTFYSVVEPSELLQRKNLTINKLQTIVPELEALSMSATENKVKTAVYEGLEGVKRVYENIMYSSAEMDEDQPYMTFVGSDSIDPSLIEYFKNDFIKWRLQFPKKTKAIVAKSNSGYAKYHLDKHDSIVIDDALFNFANEIVVHGKDQISLLMYGPGEMSGIIIRSQSLHNSFKAIFHFIWKIHTNKK